jgi:hypothetical protein
MTPNNRFLALDTAAVLNSAAPRAHATLAAAATFDEKVENASSIILGKCVKTESKLDPTGRWILTYSTFQIESSLKGGAASQITIVTPGGQVGSIRQETIGIPQFREGDENLVFVKSSKLGPTVLYFDQGAYEISKDDHGDKVITPITSSLVKIDTQRGVAVPDEGPQRLAEFKERVTSSLRDREQRRMKYEMAQSKKQEQRQASIGSVLLRYKWFVGIALIGAALATWQLLRR